jgi:hypothetical protein
MADSILQFKEKIKEQDAEIEKGLDIMSRQLDNLGERNRALGDEFVKQGIVIADIENGVDHNITNLQHVNARLKKILDDMSTHGCSYIFIVVLVVLIIALIAVGVNKQFN